MIISILSRVQSSQLTAARICSFALPPSKHRRSTRYALKKPCAPIEWYGIRIGFRPCVSAIRSASFCEIISTFSPVYGLISWLPVSHNTRISSSISWCTIFAWRTFFCSFACFRISKRNNKKRNRSEIIPTSKKKKECPNCLKRNCSSRLRIPKSVPPVKKLIPKSVPVSLHQSLFEHLPKKAGQKKIKRHNSNIAAKLQIHTMIKLLKAAISSAIDRNRSNLHLFCRSIAVIKAKNRFKMKFKMKYIST